MDRSTRVLTTMLYCIRTSLLATIHTRLTITIPTLLSITQHKLLLTEPLHQSLKQLLLLKLLLSSLGVQLQLRVTIIIVIRVSHITNFQTTTMRIVHHTGRKLCHLLTSNQVIGIQSRMNRGGKLSRLLSGMAKLGLRHNTRNTIRDLTLTRLTTRLRGFYPLLLYRPNHRVVRHGFLVNSSNSILTNRLQSTSSSLILSILIKTTSTTGQLSSTTISLHTLLTNKQSSQTTKGGLSTYNSRRLNRTLFNRNMLNQNHFISMPLTITPLILNFLRLVSFTIVRINTSFRKIRRQLLSINGLHRNLRQSRRIMLHKQMLLHGNRHDIFILFIRNSHSY